MWARERGCVCMHALTRERGRTSECVFPNERSMENVGERVRKRNEE